MLKGKKIILGVTGSIAAYKAAMLIRLMVKAGAEVKVIMTELARQFITPLTLATLSKNPVLVEFFDPENGAWNNHVDLGTWADAFVVAPATANTLAKMCHGIADNLLLTTYLSARCPVFIAPAMDLDMLQHSATQSNLRTLGQRNHIIIDPATGELASGLEGKGRMEDPEKIIEALEKYFEKPADEKKKSESLLKGKKVLITAGPTLEPLDPVRYIGNRSSGKMGYALAMEFAGVGATVVLISGPTALLPPENISECIPVQTAGEMLSACEKHFDDSHIIILAAAVADYQPRKMALEKIKSTETEQTIHLVKTPDIAQTLGKRKKENQFILGFALETSNELENAREKLKKKNFDMIVINSLRDQGAGFGFDTNKITILDKHNKIHNFGLKTKNEVARDILALVTEKSG
jgi:phosphopantothenoylcysteine decarboxylase/phosphopantothenate--cysteine ligase